MLRVAGLSRFFGGLAAVRDVSFDIGEGRPTGMVGPNGAGKTTVFNLVTGFLKPSSGRVELCGRDITGWRPHRVTRAGMARTFQHLRVFDTLTVAENVLGAIPGQPGERALYSLARPLAVGARQRADLEVAMSWLEFVGLADKRHAMGNELSYGQQKRLSIARVLATGADLLLLDEPSSGLDPSALEGLLQLIERLPAAGKTLVLVEHNLEVVNRLCDHLLFLDRGRLIAQGTPEEIYARSDLAALYFGKGSTSAAS
jgi:ABC-type branched-subunit amino acid transport system ATPase component